MKRNLYHIAAAALLLSTAFSMGCEVRGRVESEPAWVEQTVPDTYALKGDPTFVVEWTKNSLSSSYYIDTGERVETDTLEDALAVAKKAREMRGDDYGQYKWNTQIKIFVVYEVQQ